MGSTPFSGDKLMKKHGSWPGCIHFLLQSKRHIDKLAVLVVQHETNQWFNCWEKKKEIVINFAWIEGGWEEISSI